MKTNLFNIFCLVFIILLLLYPEKIHSQIDDNGAPYFPLRVGNAFYYRYYHCNPGGCDSAFVISRITQTKIFNGKRYYYVSNLFGRKNSNVYLRYNSSTGYLVYLDSNNAGCNYEMAIYNLSAIIGDSVSSSCRYGVNFKCKSIVDSSVFGTILRVKKFGYYATSYGWITEAGTHFARQRGCLYDYSATYNNSFAAYQRFLQGCKVNNIVYGDTIDHITSSFADSSRYFPLKIGNKYYYKYNYTYHRSSPDSTAYDSSYYIVNITDTTEFHGKLYYKMNSFINGTYNYFRHDLDSGFLVAYDSSNWCTATPYELKCFMLSSNANQNGSGTCWINNYISRCFEIHDTNAFGPQRKVKGFMTGWGGTSGGHYYTWLLKDIGLCQYEKYYYSNSFGYYITQKYKLIGAYVNGVKYGDTNTVSINSISNVIPDKNALYQNYPNPFNPTTNVKFSILNSGEVKLVVYDIMGREIQTLVNEKLQPGTYETTFNGYGLTSGIYFYQLRAGEFIDTKKLILLK